jgi:hypothetical protein
MRGHTLRRRYGRARTKLALGRHVYLLTHRGAWRYERVPAKVGMVVRANLGVTREGQSRSGTDDYVITRVDPKHDRVAVKPVHFAGSELWGDAHGYLVMEGSR